MSTIPMPPVGARMRHTSTYADGTILIIEGLVHVAECGASAIFIGSDETNWYAALADRPGGYTVAMEVLETPLPPEPPVGSVVRDFHGTVWQRLSDGECEWASAWSNPGGADWRFVAARGPLTPLVPDPAADAPDLPWHDHGRDLRARIQWGSIGEPYLEMHCGVRTEWSADEGMDDLKAFIGALSHARRQLQDLARGWRMQQKINEAVQKMEAYR